MRTKFPQKNKVKVITLGCAKNVFDSEVLMGQLLANGLHVVKRSKANIIVINTCGFIENAKQESINTILEYINQKESREIDKLFVTGCLSERYKDDLIKELPQVDRYFGTSDLPLLLKALNADYKHELVGQRLLTTPRHFAYLKISEGCNRPCSFCAIPIMRKHHKSTPIDELVDQTKQLVEKGVKELILIAQDSTYYGIDLYGKRMLHELLNRLADVAGIHWIRLHYAFPTGFPLEVLDVIKNRKNICNYLDIPLQHISDDILRSMRRGTTKLKTNRLIETIRSKIPEIALRTTLIVGYPGETENHFNELLSWVKQIQFDRLGCFTYSHEENTHAYRLQDDIPIEIKNLRLNQMMKVQSDISFKKNQRLIGGKLDCLIDRKEGGYFVGRTYMDSPDVDNEVLIDSRTSQLNIGEFYPVEIKSASEFDLIGQPFENGFKNLNHSKFKQIPLLEKS